MQSMKEALAAMDVKAKYQQNSSVSIFERQIQKLEADIRGHIKVIF
jgi:hypothetical protein